MKFDTIIIGGGLAGLTCGIRLQQQGQRCAIISAGQSALHFSSGSFDLLSHDAQGKDVINPLDAVSQLNEEHPYHKIGDALESYAEMAREQLSAAGVEVQGGAARNHYRYTPMGTLQPTWLTFAELATAKSLDGTPKGKILIANFAGFLDFNTNFIFNSLQKGGAQCDLTAIEIEGIERLRVSPTEMRAANIAKALEFEDTFEALVAKLNSVSRGYDWVVLPAVFGFKQTTLIKRLEKEVNVKLMILPTMPPSVPGVRTQMALRREFERLGGVYMLGDTILKADVENQRVKRLFSVNHVEIPLTAQNFVLATGHFFSGGVRATISEIHEPIFGCDVDYLEGRDQWYDQDVFKKHNFSSFGVATDSQFRVKKQGVAFENLYAVGSVLSGANSLAEGSGAGVSMLTALYVADQVMKGQVK